MARLASGDVLSIMALVAVLLTVYTGRSDAFVLAEASEETARRILVFGGNGFLGATTVERLIKLGDSVTIVNRGNWYWDSKERIQPYVQSISCDRKTGVSSCTELVELIKEVGKFDAVIDFSAYDPQDTREAAALLRGKADIYVHISTDSVYDVCDFDHQHDVPWSEEDAVRPNDSYIADMLNTHHDYGHRKLQAEEELVAQRAVDSEGNPGIPYVILRLPDVIGPRDTTYRFWIYQLWVRMGPVLPNHPVTIPRFLDGYNNSFVYVDDVASAVAAVLSSASDERIVDQAFNLAWPEFVTLERFLRDVESALGITEPQEIKTDTDASNLYLYPSVRRGPVNSAKALSTLNWVPTPWADAIKETVDFYEAAMTDPKWKMQLDEIIQIQSSHLYTDDKEDFVEALEKTYNINLTHFKPIREDL